MGLTAVLLTPSYYLDIRFILKSAVMAMANVTHSARPSVQAINVKTKEKLICTTILLISNRTTVVFCVSAKLAATHIMINDRSL